MPDEAAVAVKVAVRARPPLPEEHDMKGDDCVQILRDTAQVVVASEHGFSFDYAFDATTSQEELYNTCIADLVSKVTSGEEVHQAFALPL